MDIMDREKEKLVTVIVTVYNVEKYLDDCINSICKQTYSKLQIILIDDGSEAVSYTHLTLPTTPYV